MPKGGDTQRKEWDKDEYRQKAKERERNYHKKVEIPVDKSTLAVLEARQEISTLALQGLNEKKTVSSIDAETSGFHCGICNETYKDNLGYLDHINSPFHLKNAGQSMRVRRSTVEEVRARILARKKKPEPKIDPLERIEARQKDLEAKRLQRLEQRRREKEKLKSANDDSEMAMLMGFGGFGTSKSN